MTMNELAKWFQDKDDIAVIAHVAPDGDAVGSAIAVKLAFEKMGKRACAVLSDGVPKNYLFLPDAESVCGVDNLPFEPRCAFSVDTSEARRMGSARAIFDRCPYKASMDHHETNVGFGDAFYVDGTRASTGELALEFVKALGVAVHPDIAANVFVALATDTGNFNYKSTDARAYRAAAECVEAGAEVGPLTKKAFRTRTLERTKLLGEALMRVKTRLGGKIAYTFVNNDMLARTGATLEDAGNISNYLNEVAGAMVGVYFEEQSDNTKISWRAACGLNVAELASHFGGGGHDAAAGANILMTMDEAMKAVLDKTCEALAAYEAAAAREAEK
jgi:phosphoesterase RecJ-like protein